MATQGKSMMNGVDTQRLVATIDAIKGEPTLADFRFRAHTTWKGGARAETRIKGFHGAGKEDDSRTKDLVMQGDEPPVLLGENAAPNAVEAILHALTSCLTVGFVYNAAAKGIHVKALEFDIEGHLDLHKFLGLDMDKRAGYDQIRVTYRVDADAPRDQLVALCEYVQKTSPVLDILRNPVDVSIKMA